MKFNNGSERVRLENRWKKLRIQYREAGMSEDAIQAMYQFDLDVLNERPKHILFKSSNRSSALGRLTRLLKWWMESHPSIPTHPSNHPLRTLGVWRR